MELTHDEIERMRQIVLQHDQATQKGMKEFDLNNPPKEPYRFKKFPMLVYDPDDGSHQQVENEAELKEALAEGWVLVHERPAVEAAEPELTGEEAAEAAEIQKKLDKLNKQAGKKKPAARKRIARKATPRR